MLDTIVSKQHPKRLQIVFLATGAFAVPSMRMIFESGLFDVTCLVTNPLRYDRAGRPIVTPARDFAKKYNIAISEKEDVHSREFSEFLYLVRPDLLFVCDFGQILSKKVLEGALLGGINLHGSLLPKYRGAAPVHWAVMRGETVTGVSIIHMTPQIDAGPVIAQSVPIPISPSETVEQLEERLAVYGAELVLETIRRMACDEPVRIIEQLHHQASKAPKLKKDNGQVDWSADSKAIYNHFRAVSLWPKPFTGWHREDGSELRLIFGDMEPLDDNFHELVGEDFSHAPFVDPVLTDAKFDNLAALRAHADAGSDGGAGEQHVAGRHTLEDSPRRPRRWQPGTVIYAGGDELIVAAGQGTVRIRRLQPAGKKMMAVRDFLRGYPIRQGDRLG